MEQAGWDLKQRPVLKSTASTNGPATHVSRLRRRQSRAQGHCWATHIDTIKVHVLANLIGHLHYSSPGGLGSPILGRPGDTHRPQRGCQVTLGIGGANHTSPRTSCTKQPSPMRQSRRPRGRSTYCKKPEHLLVQGPPRSLNNGEQFLSWLPPTRRHQPCRAHHLHFTSSLSELPPSS